MGHHMTFDILAEYSTSTSIFLSDHMKRGLALARRPHLQIKANKDEIVKTDEDRESLQSDLTSHTGRATQYTRGCHRSRTYIELQRVQSLVPYLSSSSCDMLSLIVCAGAVPFGYTSEMNDCDYQCFGYGDQCVTTAEMNWRNLQIPQGQAPLPDVILSNTPPPSPLRRAHSYHFLFPEEAAPPPTRSNKSSWVPPRRPPPAPRDPQQQQPQEGDALRTGLGHIQEVRRTILREERPHPHYPHHSHDLPQLSWDVPRLHQASSTSSLPHARTYAHEDAPVREGGRTEGLTEQQRRWKHIGQDLRKLADQFTLDHAKVGTKQNDEAPLSLSVPVAVTRCLTATILCLVWWRLLNKFR
ncbi:uncharacterized protein LOC122265298 [Penaeus japonicus]|uniref:uncharacterized protein LOC122265298 n=1 Tax=Penaeus japonicus TaxID=27405 RepID=UPI001C717574|nr:uncharacterized protein LOC122265298 [Penaeus japonicus]